MDDVEELIIEALQKMSTVALRRKWSSTTLWTSRVKQAIVDVGEQHYFCLTAANGCHSYQRKEWLYDVVWYLQDKTGYTIDVPFVVEIEWNHNGINGLREDFEKLLVACAKYRVMIFDAPDEYRIRERITHIRSWI